MAKKKYPAKSSEESCPCRGDTVPRFLQPLILAELMSGDRHGYEILQRMVQTGVFTDAPPSEAGMYRIMKDMAKRGLCSSSWDTSGSGPARHVYRITPAGHKCLQNWRETLLSYQTFLSRVSELVDAALTKNSASP
jgi:DNA-binding PadR family transcriptional regulator